MRKKLNQEFRAILGEAPIRERLMEGGYSTIDEGVEDFGRFLQDDERISRKLMEELHVKVE